MTNVEATFTTDARGFSVRGVERIETDPSGRDLLEDGPVREHHPGMIAVSCEGGI